ncbi:DNA methyltransferase [Variovorax sp. LT1P1]|uniref:DNA methyltransferase n=1 Tax=Variovorax sp. LT1P1 TaxID=3443730 RepID=UPI003F4830CF
MTKSPAQADLFEPLLQAYRDGAANDEGVLNADLYRRLGLVGGERVPVGASGEKHNLDHRKLRWQQQTLRALGLIERVPGKRGAWRLKPREELTPAEPGVKLLAFSTTLGLGLWARCEDIFSSIDEPIHLCLTSPPYPLQTARAYGGPTESQFVDFICKALEPIVRNMARGASLCLNIGNDVFKSKSPARSMYVERTVLAMHDKLGLELMDRLIFESNKPPGPTWWACRQRNQLVGTYEHVLWFCNDPVNTFADNRRVLQPHTDAQKALIARGGERGRRESGDGAFRIRPGSFGGETAGRIPRNVLNFAVGGALRAAHRKELKELGLPLHGAPMPLGLASFLVKFLTTPGQLVVDPFAGDFTTPLAAEQEGCRWIASELMGEHCLGGSHRMRQAEGYQAFLEIAV